MSLELTHQWLLEQEEVALSKLIECCNINSWTANPEGVLRMRQKLAGLFAPLGAEMEENTLLTFKKRPLAPFQVLLGGHLDTVHPIHSPFQSARQEGLRLIGPGVCDMKGGLITLLYALSALEKCDQKEKIGWKVCINSDEEIGSPASRKFWIEQVPHFDFALLFEPSFPDGAFVSSRKGSLNIECTAKGVSAHAGRDFHQGRSASKAIVAWASECFLLADSIPDLIFNLGSLQAGHAANIVPDFASCKINIRSNKEKDLLDIRRKIEIAAIEVSKRNDVALGLKEISYTPPKEYSASIARLCNALESTAHDLGQPFALRESGGACDGNALAQAGLPNIDTMGVIGGKMHTEEEYMEIPSLIQRAGLAFELLYRYAQGEWPELRRRK